MSVVSRLITYSDELDVSPDDEINIDNCLYILVVVGIILWIMFLTIALKCYVDFRLEQNGEETLITYFDKLDVPSEDEINIPNWCLTLIGFGLLPWRLFITIASECYVNFRFEQDGEETLCSIVRESMGSLIITPRLPDAATMVFNLFLIITALLNYRVFVPVRFNMFYLIQILIFIDILGLVPNLIKPVFYFIIGMTTVIHFRPYGNWVYGVFTEFPHTHIGVLLIVNNICGLLITFVKICVTYCFYNLPNLVATVYYSIFLAILVLCVIAYRYYYQKEMEVREKDDTNRLSLFIFWTTFKNCYGQLFNVWFCFAVTFIIFPIMMIDTTCGKYGFFNTIPSKNDEAHKLLNHVLVFNLFASIGTILASKIHWPTPKYLSLAIIARVLFIPVFFFCNYRVETRAYPVLFDNTDMFVVAGILMALSHGYLSALAMGYTTNVCPSHYSRIAAQLSVCTLLIGLFAGGLCVVFIESLVDGLDIF